ncbi:MAG: DUF624 domain-containing protein [Chloroflexota bacterium]|nr:DUF624 domain-containing protein [Chloroflexota bacterium]
MIAALRVFGRAAVDLKDALFVLAGLNLLWTLLSLTLVLLPPATAAMFEATHELVRGRAPEMREFLDAVRRHFVRAWAWALVNVLAWVVLLANLLFYGALRDVWAVALQALFTGFAAFWLVSQFYVWPFVFEQAEMSLRWALRNAVLTVFAAPVFSLTLAALGGLALVLSVLLVAPLVLATTAFLCLVANHAVIDRLRAFQKLPAPPPADAT